MILNRAIIVEFIKEVAFEQKCEEMRELLEICRKRLPGRGNTAWPVWRIIKEASVPGVERGES